MREIVEVAVEICDARASLPVYARAGDAGMDISSIEDVLIKPGQTKVVRTGLKAAIPEGYEIQVRPRSGLSLKSPLRLANAPGTIDAGYRDEIGIIVHNISPAETYEIKKGDRIAQLVLQKVPEIRWVQVEDVQTIGQDRGGGFGSSGR